MKRSGYIIIGICLVIAIIVIVVLAVTLPRRANSRQSASNVVINTIGNLTLKVGTRPHWDAETKTLYYVDVETSEVYKYDPSSGSVVVAKVGAEPLGFMFPVNGIKDKFVAALGRKLLIVTWDGTHSRVNSTEVIAEVDSEITNTNNRLNGGKVDPYGILWAGTMGPTDSNGVTAPGMGSLYSLNSKTVKKHLSNIGISNGLAWDKKKKKMYYIDTLFRGVYQFDYNPTTGTIENRQVIFEFKNNGIEGSPDGLVIDTDGNLWVAVIYGSRIIQINPSDGELLQSVKLPTPQVTALAFGGKNLDILYVTTAQMAVNNVRPGFPAGCLFSVEGLNATGYPGDYFIYT